MKFLTKKITYGKTFGEKLKEARTDHGLSLERAANDLNIAAKYLTAMESNRLELLPGRPYLKRFLASYCDYLNLDFAELWLLTRKTPISDEHNLSRLNQAYLVAWPKLAKAVVWLALALALVLFLVLEVRKIFSPPFLEILQPPNDFITAERRLDIVGQSEKEAQIAINNKNVFVDDAGEFTAGVDLQKGYNLIKITARKRYGRVQEKEIRVLLK